MARYDVTIRRTVELVVSVVVRANNEAAARAAVQEQIEDEAFGTIEVSGSSHDWEEESHEMLIEHIESV